MIDLLPILRQATGENGVPGAVAILVNRDGVVWSGAAGVRDTGTGDPMKVDTVFWIASMTKPLTSLAALRLVDRGLLALDAPVTSVLPQLDPFQVLEPGEEDKPVLRPARRAPTLRELLSHTSGYAYPRWDAALTRAVKQLGLPTLPRSWEELCRTPLVADPGTAWQYGIGIDVVGKMLETVCGQPLDEVVESEVCRPLGMSDTRFVLTEEQRARAAPIHVRAEGGWRPQGPVAGRRLPFLAGGGGMFGTAPDYARLLAELLVGAPRLLSRPSWAAMAVSQTGGLGVQILRSADQGQSVDLDLIPGQVPAWTLGFMLNPAPVPGRRGAGSLAWSGLANTHFWLDPAAGRGGVVMMSVLPFGTPSAMDVFARIETEAYKVGQ